MTRRRVSIRVEQLLDVHERLGAKSFADWRCRLCHHSARHMDRAAALDAFAAHLAKEHRASGGYVRRKK